MPRTRSLKWSELKLGVAGVVAITLTAFLISAVGGQGGFFWQRYALYTRFDDVGGLKSGAVVRLNGMEVGKVTRVEFAGAEVEVGLAVSEDVRHLITTDSRASMGTLSLLGEPIVDLSAAASGTVLPTGGFVPPGTGGGVARLTSSASRSAEEFGSLIADVRSGRGAVGSLFADPGMQQEMEQLMGSAARVAKHLEKGHGTLGALAQDPSAYLALRGALDNLSVATARLNGGEGAISRMLNDATLGRSLANTSSSLDEITGRLARGEGTAGKLLADASLFDGLADLTTRLDRTLLALESPDGTTGALLKERELYDNVNQAALELRSLVSDIRQNPTKYLTVRFSVF